MKELTDLFLSIKNESGRIGKEEILKNNKDNELFLDILKFVYNPYIVTGISNRKINKNVEHIDEAFIPITITGLMDYLEEYNSGRDIDIYVVQQYINKLQTEEEKDLLKQIVTKSLKIGVTAKTINKVYGENTIPTFDVMLANSFDKKEKSVTGEFYITLKLDGNRSVCIVEDGKVKFYSRQGKVIEGLVELEQQFSKFPDGVYDGEILLRNDKDLPSDELFRETQKIVRRDGEKTGLKFYIFDFLTNSEFKRGKSKKTYSQRRNFMDAIISKYTNDSDNIILLSVLYRGSDKEVIPTILKEVEEEGFEGIMLNTADGLYECKRTNSLLKIKTFLSSDGVVMGVYEGQGKNEGKLGGVLITYKDKAVRVGSGFTDEERSYYWDNKDEIIGKVGQYNYFEESQNQDGEIDLRFATWKGIREDKSAKDVNYE